MAYRPPRYVIVAQVERVHSQRIARACQSDVSTDPWKGPTSSVRASVSLRVFTVRERAGIGEGT